VIFTRQSGGARYGGTDRLAPGFTAGDEELSCELAVA
jgi:hypothetical protein